MKLLEHGSKLTIEAQAPPDAETSSRERVTIDTSQDSPPDGRQPESPRRNPASAGVWQWPLIRRALGGSVIKLDPRRMVKNPVMFVVEIGSLMTTIVGMRELVAGSQTHLSFVLQISLWLWFTVLFANFAEALAEARGKAQADTLRATRQETQARRVQDGREEIISSSELRRGDIVAVHEGELIPSDGDVIAGVAYVDEAAITGESAPVLKEPGTDIRSSVTGGTRVVSDRLTIQVTADPGHTFIDRMIALVEGAERQKTPNEIALSILLTGLSIIFLLVVVTLEPFSIYAKAAASTVVLISLLVCLLPTTIGALLSAIGIAGMDRVTRFNVLAMSGHAVEAAGDVDTLLLDKTGTITYGNRLAAEVLPIAGANPEEALSAAYWASLGDETPEGRSVVALVQRLVQSDASLNGFLPDGHLPGGAEVIPFSAETRRSGLRLDGTRWCKGAVDAIYTSLSRTPDDEVRQAVDRIAGEGGTPLVVAKNERPLALIYLKDTVKPGLPERFAELRCMGIRTIMVTGDNLLTANTIAREAGVDEVMAQARPEDKIARIRKEQEAGHLVAMSG